MFFRIVTIVSVLGLLSRLTYLRFVRHLVTSGRTLKRSLLLAFFSWLGERASGMFKLSAAWPSLRSLIKNWLDFYASSWMRWTVAALALSFLFLAASGFGFAVFTSRGIFGLPLLFHVIAGGIFAACLSVLVLVRAREHTSLQETPSSPEFSGNPSSPLPSPGLFISSLFWLFVVSGLFLIATALLSMLPYFTSRGQLELVQIHRYSALIALLTAILFFDAVILPKEK
jgi:hypothetical protein